MWSRIRRLAIIVGIAFVGLLGLGQGSTVRTAMGQTPPAPDPVPAEIFREDVKTERSGVTPTLLPMPHIRSADGKRNIRKTDGTWNDQGPGPNRNGQVQNLTPNNEVSGAIHAVVAHPTDPNILYVGAVNGGVWRTTNATAASPTWTPLTDFEQSLSIGALEMDPEQLADTARRNRALQLVRR